MPTLLGVGTGVDYDTIDENDEIFNVVISNLDDNLRRL